MHALRALGIGSAYVKTQPGLLPRAKAQRAKARTKRLSRESAGRRSLLLGRNERPPCLLPLPPHYQLTNTGAW
jgi:hypothetical protein